MKKIWPFIFYCLYFAAFASLMPFFVLFYQRLRLSGAQIGLLTGIPPLITLVATPFWTSLADAKRWHKLVMGMGMAIAILIFFVIHSFTSFAIVFTLIIVYTTFFSPVPSLADS